MENKETPQISSTKPASFNIFDWILLVFFMLALSQSSITILINIFFFFNNKGMTPDFIGSLGGFIVSILIVISRVKKYKRLQTLKKYRILLFVISFIFLLILLLNILPYLR